MKKIAVVAVILIGIFVIIFCLNEWLKLGERGIQDDKKAIEETKKIEEHTKKLQEENKKLLQELKNMRN